MQGHPEGHSLAEVSLQVWELHGVQAGVHHHLAWVDILSFSSWGGRKNKEFLVIFEEK